MSQSKAKHDKHVAMDLTSLHNFCGPLKSNGSNSSISLSAEAFTKNDINYLSPRDHYLTERILTWHEFLTAAAAANRNPLDNDGMFVVCCVVFRSSLVQRLQLQYMYSKLQYSQRGIQYIQPMATSQSEERHKPHHHPPPR